MSGVTILNGVAINTLALQSLDARVNDWFCKAARGECHWICPDCCQYFGEGMPDACCYGHQSCTDLLQRDKKAAVASHNTENGV